MKKYDVIVVGGGISGLVTAIYAAQAGKKTIVVEKQCRLGGNAVTNKKETIYFNLGGHALYYGDAYDTFKELGLSLKGGQPSLKAYGIWKNTLKTLPTGFTSLLKTPLLSFKGKMELASWLVKFKKLDTKPYNRISLQEWMEGNVKDAMVRTIFYAIIRTATYVSSPDLQAAGPALRQIQSVLKGVWYLDRGWGALIEELHSHALKQEVEFLTHTTVINVDRLNGVVQGIECKDGTRLNAENIVLAIPIDRACEMVQGVKDTSLQRWKDQSVKVTAACLDVALKRLPDPNNQFVYGLDQPVFLSNQSRAAYLSEDGSQVISLINYETKGNSKQDLQELEEVLDFLQPGWRKELEAKQFLSQITVCHDFMHMNRKENPGPSVPEIKGLYVAGEWASHGELLVDAATASAKRAAAQLLQK
ncbi:phytoene desaturase family protein [Jeotgalibacillus proteolyticus]|uniref:Dehydrogenase n=1 Tax=Jeotgalibacillus proteolyticus TaxID=2082395 RepID=A0A2S5GDP5_9BACL|nr:FAD-dependent oxidoreductase [Jeotgalibacillus proteolyticus]PPA71109.1 dehydrogenase [Jeotgalibacillus proteolyticus]